MNLFSISLSEYIKFLIGLFVIVNPVGVLPIFIGMTSTQSVTERKQTNIVAHFTVAAILCISLFLGDSILRVFGISIESFRIAGGILILTIAMSMISGKLEKSQNNKKSSSDDIDNNSNGNIGVVPLALPLMAGPGAISSTIVWSTHSKNIFDLLGFSLSIMLFSFFCWLLFLVAPYVVRILGKTGISIVTKIMGLLLMSLGIEFIVTGIKVAFPSFSS
ncbi:YchE family NAAT transporter [Candidatus Tachikawaea gelatinosa]|uniref:UPF0056 membrane protein n=1 Tax=Candidatus Tachikawaea gelatinosa TaxID=1410383 RepID=A0A090ASC3_9ENTR|nr:YchE family NAAT transporter [Candidatus Tachikawaea gelatinosa]BAP58775.1 putative MarC family transporter yhcE [Candidatus Tachikawaea gelatinosa]